MYQVIDMASTLGSHLQAVLLKEDNIRYFHCRTLF